MILPKLTLFIISNYISTSMKQTTYSFYNVKTLNHVKVKDINQMTPLNYPE